MNLYWWYLHPTNRETILIDSKGLRNTRLNSLPGGQMNYHRKHSRLALFRYHRNRLNPSGKRSAKMNLQQHIYLRQFWAEYECRRWHKARSPTNTAPQQSNYSCKDSLLLHSITWFPPKRHTNFVGAKNDILVNQVHAHRAKLMLWCGKSDARQQVVITDLSARDIDQILKCILNYI